MSSSFSTSFSTYYVDYDRFLPLLSNFKSAKMPHMETCFRVLMWLATYHWTQRLFQRESSGPSSCRWALGRGSYLLCSSMNFSFTSSLATQIYQEEKVRLSAYSSPDSSLSLFWNIIQCFLRSCPLELELILRDNMIFGWDAKGKLH